MAERWSGGSLLRSYVAERWSGGFFTVILRGSEEMYRASALVLHGIEVKCGA